LVRIFCGLFYDLSFKEPRFNLINSIDRFREPSEEVVEKAEVAKIDDNLLWDDIKRDGSCATRLQGV